MKSKTTKVRRYLAAILTVLMIFQQATTSVIYASSEAAVPTVTEAPAAQTEETPEKQVEETPEEKTPTEEENEGEESAAPTEAPAENEAEPEVTVTPAAEPTATEAPAVEATATPVPEATPIPEVTETPEETPKTDFTYEDSRVAITAKAEEGANLPQDAELKADYIDPNSDVYKAAVEAFNVQLGNDDTVADYVLYDIYFLSASKEGRIEPEDGNVTVNVTFKTQQETENKGEILESQVVHLDDQNNAEVVSGNVDISSDGTVQSMTFTNNSFSPYGFRLAYAKQATPTVKSNEYYMTLEEAKKTTVKLGMADDIRNAVQNFKIEIQCTYYDEAQNELNGINPDKFRDIQIRSMSGGRYLGNDFQNVDSRVAYVKITMLENELKNTFFTFGKNGPVKNGNDITFNIETRTFQPDEVWEANGLTYIAVGPEHQYNVSGPLGLINNFHAVGFTKVHNSVHTNGNVLTKELTYGSNFGTKQVSNEISYIESFTSIENGMQCGADDNDILVIGKDIKVTCDGQHFYLNGQKLDKPKTVYQDTQDYKFLDVSSLKTEAVQLSTGMAGQPDQGVTKSEGKLIISEGYSGTAVCNITLEELQSHSQIEGLSNNSGTSLILNIKVSGDSVIIPQLSLNNVNNTGGEQGDFSAGKLIWNILNQDGTPYTGSVLQKEATTGTILVPNGTFTTRANWNGSMIANVVNINAESHRTDFTGTMGFGVEKLVEKDKSDAWQNNYKFQFELSAANGTPMPKGSKENSEENLAKVIEASYGNRTPSFGLITYSQSDIGKTYEYTLRELLGNVSGISYSKVVYKIKVEIQSNEGVGLSITRSYSSDGGNTWTAGLPKGDRFTFTNTFNNNEKGSLTIIKNVTGENDDFAGTFYFTVTQGNKYSSYKYYDLNGNASSSKKVLALEYANKAGSITLNNLSVGTYEVTEVADAKGTAIKNATKFPYTVSKIKGSVEVVAGNAVEYTVTNSKGELKVSATVKKVWNDGNNRDGKRPENLKVDLKKGDTVIKEVTLNAGNNWTATVTDLEEKENGQTIEYTWSEKDLPEGYSLTSTNKEGSITTLTNSYTPGKVSATVKKIWDDGNNQDGKRPENLKVDLKKGDTVIKEVTLNAGNNWTATVTDLEEKENGQTIDYTWSEKDLPEGYSLTSTNKEGSITTLTNSYTPGKVSATVKKIWDDGNNQDGKRPENLKVELKKGETVVKEVTLNAGNNWTATVTDLEEKENGQTIEYTWSEKDLPEGYSLTSTNKEGSITTLTNSYTPGKVSATVKKIWDDGNNQDGKRPENLKVDLKKGDTVIKEVTLNAGNNWTATVTDLEEKENGQTIDYTWSEKDLPEGYSLTSTNKEGSITTLTNSYTPGKVSATVKKIWDDGNNQDGKRPENLKVELKKGETVVKEVTLNAGNNWTATVTDLEEKENGQTIDYTWSEKDLPEGYSLTSTNKEGSITTLTNSYTPGKVSATVKKIWDDGNNQDGKRPENLKVELKKGETVVKEVTLNAGNNWTATVTDLEEKENGQTIDYTWSEKDLPEGYSLTSTDKEGSITTLTNTYFIETIKIEGTKTWSDGGNQDGSRPSSITVNLLANGTKVASKEVTAKDNWKYSFTDLPKYENGIAINYTVTEDAVAGYSTTINGYDITNSYTPGQTSVTVTKAWVDNDNKGNKRPSEIKVQLYADGRESGSSVTLNEANKWTYTWTGLDEKNGGTTIAYTVKEIGTVDGYEASVSGDARTGYTITNTLKSGTLEIVKSITGDVSDSALTAEQKAAMTFTVTGPDGYSETVHYSDFVNGKYTFQNLPLGEYTVTETNADMEGYKLTTTYSVDGGKVTVTNKETATITITNDYTKTKDVSVKISKVDADTYEVLGGAHLQVIDPDGKVVAEWDSDKDAYTLTDLKPGVVYTLHETAAPKGYKVADDTTFQLNEDGTIDTANTTTAISDETLLVKDEKKESKDVSVSVTKKLVTVDGTVIGAVDATYYVALYSDADCTQRVSDVLALNFKNASASTVTFTGLEKGQTYYVGECEADGTCYLANICADGTMYMVDFSDGNAVTVDNADGSTTVYFDNQFENIPDGYYKEAELNITKKLVGSDGKAKNSNEIFYAGIFADEGFTQLSTDVSQNIVPLDLAGGSEATALVNVALPESGSITLYVTEVDSNGKPVAGAASFKYDVTVDNAQVTLNDDNLSANVVITNTENSTKVTPTPGTPNTPNTTGGFSGKSAVRTGDSTPIGGFIALFAAAAVIAGAAVFFKRRRKDEK